VPWSVLTGRPAPKPGEPLFLEEDTAAAVALAEEERDSCGSCGMPKAWCRDPKHQFGTFEPVEEVCWVTYRLAQHQAANGEWDKKADDTKRATQLSVRFREGREPDPEAGLELDAQVD
jgi:hypothetical protein